MKHNILLIAAVSALLSGCAVQQKYTDNEVAITKINTLKGIVDLNPEAALLGTAMIGAVGDRHRSVITAISGNNPASESTLVDVDKPVDGQDDAETIVDVETKAGVEEGDDLQGELKGWWKGILGPSD